VKGHFRDRWQMSLNNFRDYVVTDAAMWDGDAVMGFS
jgi:hypothetical protein